VLPQPAAVSSMVHLELLADPDAISMSHVLQVPGRVTQGAAPFVYPVAQQHCHDKVCRQYERPLPAVTNNHLVRTAVRVLM